MGFLGEHLAAGFFVALNNKQMELHVFRFITKRDDAFNYHSIPLKGCHLEQSPKWNGGFSNRSSTTSIAIYEEGQRYEMR